MCLCVCFFYWRAILNFLPKNPPCGPPEKGSGASAPGKERKKRHINWDPARPLQQEFPRSFGPGIPEESLKESPGAGSQHSGKEKTHKHKNKFAGLSRDWVGAKILFMCFFLRVIPYGGEKHMNKIPPPPKSRDNPVKCLFCFFSLCVFSRSQNT